MNTLSQNKKDEFVLQAERQDFKISHFRPRSYERAVHFTIRKVDLSSGSQVCVDDNECYSVFLYFKLFIIPTQRFYLFFPVILIGP